MCGKSSVLKCHILKKKNQESGSESISVGFVFYSMDLVCSCASLSAFQSVLFYNKFSCLVEQVLPRCCSSKVSWLFWHFALPMKFRNQLAKSTKQTNKWNNPMGSFIGDLVRSSFTFNEMFTVSYNRGLMLFVRFIPGHLIFFFIFLLSLKDFYWSIIDLQCHVNFNSKVGSVICIHIHSSKNPFPI